MVPDLILLYKRYAIVSSYAWVTYYYIPVIYFSCYSNADDNSFFYTPAWNIAYAWIICDPLGVVGGNYTISYGCCNYDILFVNSDVFYNYYYSISIFFIFSYLCLNYSNCYYFFKKFSCSIYFSIFYNFRYCVFCYSNSYCVFCYSNYSTFCYSDGVSSIRA